ncbi:hypothetical protein DPMN_191591 [Dreissena polymorpha]|uniref:Uncharacterized protein n=1 Tax=Dreissena polymorpha TaxID=45954 RepID=A0A9D4B7L7_DREPO|nr:hypothetical protein DPMN_191591 [Dreissena polymorpha]
MNHHRQRDDRRQQTSRPTAHSKPLRRWEFLTQSAAVLNKWSEYCSDLCNYPLSPYYSLLRNHHATKVRQYLMQMLMRQCVVLRQGNLREWETSLPSS